MTTCPVCRSGDVEHRMLTIMEAAIRKGAHPHTIRAAIKRGELTARRVGRMFLVHDTALAAWKPNPVGRPPRRPLSV